MVTGIRTVVVVSRGGRVVTRSRTAGVVVGRIASVVVVMGIGVVVRIHRRHAVRSTRAPTSRRRRRHHRTVAVVVVAVVTGAGVVTRTRSDMDDHPRLVAIAVPAEAYRLEVFEGGEAVELVIQLVVGHHRVQHRGVRTVGRDAYRDSSDATGADAHVLVGETATIVGIEIDVEVTAIGVVSNILNIIVDGDRIGIVGQHWL